jgi:ligand-binding sensor domain-containing protein
MGDRILRKYGVETTITFELYLLDGSDIADSAAHAAGDSTISKDEGAYASTTNGFTDEGSTYSIVLSATEMTAARISVVIRDQTSPKVWISKTLFIETYGNASAQHAFDLDTASPSVTVSSLSASVIDSIWDETLAAHTTADSAGLALKNLLKIGKNKWSYSGTAFTIYDDNGSSILYQFTLDSATAPTLRTPV